jgi:hypothetical protein
MHRLFKYSQGIAEAISPSLARAFTTIAFSLARYMEKLRLGFLRDVRQDNSRASHFP